MDPVHLSRLINQVLKRTPWYSTDAVALLCMTAATESLCGKYLFQNPGPALGVFQMEPATALDIFENWLAHRPEALAVVEGSQSGMDLDIDLAGNLPFQIVMARVHYLRDREPIPGDLAGKAAYYKRVWNTVEGAATEERALAYYRKYFMGMGR
ncbi:MAG: hypothetical protein ABIJ95_13050 [Pseudomonadota bacterium]